MESGCISESYPHIYGRNEFKSSPNVHSPSISTTMTLHMWNVAGDFPRHLPPWVMWHSTHHRWNSCEGGNISGTRKLLYNLYGRTWTSISSATWTKLNLIDNLHGLYVVPSQGKQHFIFVGSHQCMHDNCRSWSHRISVLDILDVVTTESILILHFNCT